MQIFFAETRFAVAIWSMMRSIFSLDDLGTQYPWRQYIKPHMWPFVLNFSRSKYFQTSLNIFNLFQSSLFDKYFLLPSRYQYSPGANFYIKFSLTAEAIYRWHNVGIIELQRWKYQAELGNYEEREDRLGLRESLSVSGYIVENQHIFAFLVASCLQTY